MFVLSRSCFRKVLCVGLCLLSSFCPVTYAQDPPPLPQEPPLYDELLPERTEIPAPKETSVLSENQTVKIHLRAPKTPGGVSVRVESTEVTGWEALEQTLSDARVNAGATPAAVIVVDTDVPEADVKQLSDLVSGAGFSNFYLTTAVTTAPPAVAAPANAAEIPADGGDPLAAITPEDRPKLDVVFEFNFNNTDIASALSEIMKQARIGAFVTPEVQGPINANFVDRPVGNVLGLLLRKYRLQLLYEDGFYIIRPAAPAEAPAEVPEASQELASVTVPESVVAPSQDSVFQIRLMAPPQDREQTDIDYISMETPQGTIHLPMQHEVLCTGDDVLSAELIEEPGQPLKVQIRVNDVAAARLGRATVNNLGNQLGFVYQERLIAAPTILDMMSNELQITGNGADWPARARELAEYLQPETAP